MWARYVEKFNLFQKQPSLTNKHHHQLTNICGGLLSIPIILIIFILFLLQFIQFVNRGIVQTNTQINTYYEPPSRTFTTSLKDTSFSPFMIGFAVTNDATCSSAPIYLDVSINVMTGQYNSANRSTSKIPLKLQTCNQSHFGMLPNNINKLNQYTSKPLSCLPLESYFDLGGANTLSTLYKNIKFNFTCPSACSSSPTCGKVEFYVTNSNVNLGNSGSLFTYSLDRKVFSISPKPTYQNYYQMQSTNTTTDTSVFPFSIKNTVSSFSVGNILTDIPSASTDASTYVIFESFDKSVINQRSYYKLFDLLSYMGGIISGFYIVFFFLDYITKLEFQMNFAAEYFRHRQSKTYTIYSYLKQAAFSVLKYTRWKPDWRVVEIRQEMRDTVQQVLDVTYLNKRILFLQEAISLLFQPHQLKGIYLLHNFNKEQSENRMRQHRLRDRLICYLNKSWQAQGKVYQIIKNVQTSKVLQEEQREKIVSVSKMINQHQILISSQQQLRDPNRSSKGFEIPSQPAQDPKLYKPGNITLHQVISNHFAATNSFQVESSLIKNEAEEYYQSSKAIYENAELAADRLQIQNQMQYVGNLSPEELKEGELIHDLQNDLKKLIDEAEQQGDNKSKLIVSRLEDWLRQQLRLSILKHSKDLRKSLHE